MSHDPLAAEAAKSQHDAIGAGAGQLDSKANHPEAQWFGQKKLGLFVHWGISSVRGSVDLSWGMIRNKPWGGASVSPAQYWAQAREFQPACHDPERYLQAVADAGFEYAVFTTKHHDGYLMWPAQQTSLGTATDMKRRDLVAPYIEACRNVGLKVGLYYSPPDWWFSRKYLLFDYNGLKLSSQEPERSVQGLGIDYEPKSVNAPHAGFVATRRNYLRSHIFELLNRWGRIDLLWFDGRGVPEAEPAIMELDEIRQIQPWIVINPRLTGTGDYVTFECRDATVQPSGWWEKCTQWNKGGWGYFTSEEYYSGAEIFNDYRKVHDAGGNYLINAAPRSDGSMPETFYRELESFKSLKLKSYDQSYA